MTPKQQGFGFDPIWAVEPRAFDSARAEVRRMNVEAARSNIVQQSAPYERVGGVAVIALTGFIQKRPTLFSLFFATTSTVEVADVIRRALADETVSAIALYIDSPGGSASGVSDLALEIFRARTKKPVFAIVSDLAASAAYYAASQATKIYANEAAEIGAIGVFLVVDDAAKLLTESGITRHVVRYGRLKGAGIFGTPITDEQLQEFQSEVDAIGALFTKDVARGRGIGFEAAKALSTGELWIGARAKQRGLVDELASWPDAIDHLVSRYPGPASPAAVKIKTTAAASLHQLKANLPKSDESFRLSAIRAGFSMDRASREWEKETARRELVAVQERKYREERSRMKQRLFG